MENLNETNENEVATSELAENSENQKKNNSVWQKIKSVLSYVFIDGLSGMAVGLFATLIIGTIICQIGSFFKGNVAYYIKAVGTLAKALMGGGIAIGMAYKLKKKPMVTVSACVCGMIGAFATKIIKREMFNDAMSITTLVSVGEPLGAFIAAFVALEVGSLVAGKTKIDIIVTPLVSITAGSIVGLLVGPPISSFMTAIGAIVNKSAEQQPFLMGILVAALMGIALTLPISSAAIGVSLGLNGIAAGAAVVGCSCQMIGFAVMSFRENKWSGLVSQGLGTSMLQMPNLVKHPLCWLPPVISSIILGPIASVGFRLTSTKVGSGMGTSGLVGVLESITSMINDGRGIAITVTAVVLLCFVLPAILSFVISEIMRKLKLIKPDDLKLTL